MEGGEQGAERSAKEHSHEQTKTWLQSCVDKQPCRPGVPDQCHWKGVAEQNGKQTNSHKEPVGYEAPFRGRLTVSPHKQRDEEGQQQQGPEEDLQKLNGPLSHIQDSKGNVPVQVIPVGHLPDGIELPGLKRVIDGHRPGERLPQKGRDYGLLVPP